MMFLPLTECQFCWKSKALLSILKEGWTCRLMTDQVNLFWNGKKWQIGTVLSLVLLHYSHHHNPMPAEEKTCLSNGCGRLGTVWWSDRGSSFSPHESAALLCFWQSTLKNKAFGVGLSSLVPCILLPTLPMLNKKVMVGPPCWLLPFELGSMSHFTGPAIVAWCEIGVLVLFASLLPIHKHCCLKNLNRIFIWNNGDCLRLLLILFTKK